MSPDVTTVATPLYRIGFEAASLLIRAIVGEATIPTHIDLGFALMTRDSA
jgi:LacI family gluconate utilization system Gnt-I transcriptional repressor